MPLISEDGTESMKVSVKVRPYFDHCIAHLAQMYEIIIFTAGEQCYADAVLDYLDVEN